MTWRSLLGEAMISGLQAPGPTGDGIQELEVPASLSCHLVVGLMCAAQIELP